MTKLLFAFIMMLFLSTGLFAATVGDSPPLEGINSRQGLEPVSATRSEATAVALEQVKAVRPAARDFASSDETNKEAAKARPKTKRIVIGAVLITILAGLFINLISLSNNARFCSTCGYSGSMKPLTLTAKPALNRLLVILVRIFPLLLYYYAEKGRFLCPQCNRTSTNVTVKSRIRAAEAP